MSKCVEPVSAPEVPSEPIGIARCPLGAKRLWRAAEGTGWAIRAYYSRGPWLGARNTVSRIADAIGISFTRGDGVCAALYLTDARGAWKFEAAWVFDGALFPRNVSATELRAHLVRETDRHD